MNDDLTFNNQPACTHPDCAERAALLAALALGSPLADDERATTLDALTTCAGCRARLAAYADVAQRLPLTAPIAEPPANLRDRIVAAAAAQPRGKTLTAVQPTRRTNRSPTAHQPARPAQRTDWRRWLVPLLGLATAALLVLGIVQQQQINQQQAQIAQQQAQTSRNAQLVIAAFGNEDAQEGQLVPTTLAPDASGRFFVSPGAPALSMYVRLLPQLPADQEYQVWVTHGEQTVSAGTFSVNAQGRAWRPFQPPGPLGPITRVFVTAEPKGGSPAPSGAEYLASAP